MVNKLKNERIFVAGHTGMVGSAVCRLLKKNYVNSNHGNILLTPTRKELNLLDKELVEKWFKLNKPSIVIIAAAKVGGILANSTQPANFLLDNLNIQTNIIQAAFENRTKRLLFLGSSCIYPKFASQPIKEEFLLSGDLESTNEWYAIAKIAGIKLCQSLSIQYGFDAISLMPTNLYGPNDNYDSKNGHVMAAMMKRFIHASKKKSPYVTCWGSGFPLREFLHVDDLASAVVFCLERWFPLSNDSPKDKNGNTLYWLNVGSGNDISIKKLAEMVSYLCNYKGKIIWDKKKPDGTPKKLLSVDRLNNMGWNSKIELEDGITRTINDIRNGLEKNFN